MTRKGGEGDQPGVRVTYISWAESCSRSDHTARELNGVSHMVYLGRLGSRPSTIIFKYVGQAVRTLRILRRERPDAVFVMTPPLFAAFPAFWYARRGRAKVVLDAHSAAFLHPRWRHFQWLQAALCRRAATTLVHNDRIARFVETAGGHATLVPDVPITFSEVERFERPSEFTIAVVCSFNDDEPVEAIFAAAAMVPDVRFFITGNPKYLRQDLRSTLPQNVTLTGFVSTARYGGMLQGVDAVMALTTRDHTMLRGAYEAIYQGTPVIVSDWPILRKAFDDGAVHVCNDAEGIAEGIRTMQRDLSAYRAGADRLRQRKLTAWNQTKRAILERITSVSG